MLGDQRVSSVLLSSSPIPQACVVCLVVLLRNCAGIDVCMASLSMYAWHGYKVDSYGMKFGVCAGQIIRYVCMCMHGSVKSVMGACVFMCVCIYIYICIYMLIL